ncbi:MAG: hypothetical protein ABTQ73_02070 [Caldilineales bacterium]
MFKRIIGILLVILALVSLVLTVGSTYAVWAYRSVAADSVARGLVLLDETLGTTTGAFETVDASLGAASASVVSAKSTFNTLASTVSSSSPTLDSLADFLGEGLPDTLTITQGTLESAAGSAQLIDNVLRTMSGIRLLGIEYDPQQSLSESLDGISASLDTLPESMRALGTNLGGTSQSLPALAQSLDQFGGSLDQINASLGSAQQVMAAYKDLVTRYQGAIRSVNSFIPTIVSVGPIIFTFFAFWLAVVQAFTLMKGWQWLRGHKADTPSGVTS